jgi:hypothetical protein
MSDPKDSIALERSKEKLKRDIDKRIMKGVEEILDIAEVAISDSPRYKTFRSKVLRSLNNATRDVKNELDTHYQVVYTPTNEDVIEISKPKTLSRSN